MLAGYNFRKRVSRKLSVRFFFRKNTEPRGVGSRKFSVKFFISVNLRKISRKFTEARGGGPGGGGGFP